MVNCGLKTIKFVTFFINFLIFLLSAVVLISGGVFLSNAGKVTGEDVAEELPKSSVVFLIIIAAVVLLISFMGCCGAVKESPCLLSSYAVVILIILLTELVIAALIYRYRNDFDELGEKGLQKTLNKYNKTLGYNAIDDIQRNLQCCGVKDSSDWKDKLEGLPASCCPDHVTPCDKNNAYKSGCWAAMKDYLQPAWSAMAVVGITVALIQFAAVAGSCCLARAFRREYDVV